MPFLSKTLTQLCGIKIIELSGSPKPYFNVKSEVIAFAESKGFTHGKLNADCMWLLTDDKESNSSKMVKARKLGVGIMTYDEFKN